MPKLYKKARAKPKSKAKHPGRAYPKPKGKAVPKGKGRRVKTGAMKMVSPHDSEPSRSPKRKPDKRTAAQVAQHMAMGTGKKSFRGTIGLVSGRKNVKIGRSGVVREVKRAAKKKGK